MVRYVLGKLILPSNFLLCVFTVLGKEGLLYLLILKIDMNSVVLLFNLKAYNEGIGENAYRLAEVISEVNYENTYLAVQPTDILRVKPVWSKVLAQHVDPITPGARTGWFPIESAVSAGAIGTLVNHSEHRLSDDEIKIILERSDEFEGFKTVVCADTPTTAERLAQYNPSAIAIEPPELIGTKTPVSEARPELIEDVVSRLGGKVPVYCGAGINKPEDVAKAVDLGADGVLVASAFVKNPDPKKWLEDVVSVL